MKVLRAIVSFFYEIFLGCRHSQLTRPFTLEQQTYKVCLDCGKRIYYSTETMRPLRAREVRRIEAMQAGEVKVVPVTSATNALAPKSGSKVAA
ncbi:MAG TPA: hypothetical protein VHT24_17610 [Pseudacidobacterium sp.]|nr:hypothetical protein [Pseudacidobacterium sp.]